MISEGKALGVHKLLFEIPFIEADSRRKSGIVYVILCPFVVTKTWVYYLVRVTQFTHRVTVFSFIT